MKKTTVILTIAALLAVPLLFAQSSMRKILEVAFTGGTGTYTWAQTANPPILNSIDVTFVATNATPSTFTLSYTRSGTQHTMITMTNIVRTAIYYIPSGYFVKSGDRWSWTTSQTGAAVLTANAIQ